MTNNKTVLSWIDEMKALVNPDQIVWIDGSEEQLEALRKEACASGELIKLNEEKLPGCYYHRTAPNDVARVEDRTLICSKKEEDAGPTNHWKDPQEAYKMLYDIARGSYKGRTMYVIPYSMGPIGSPLAKIGIELTDSIYVVLNMSIMTRVNAKVLDVLGDSNDWVRGLHCKCNVDPENRWICQFPEDNTIISVNTLNASGVKRISNHALWQFERKSDVIAVFIFKPVFVNRFIRIKLINSNHMNVLCVINKVCLSLNVIICCVWGKNFLCNNLRIIALKHISRNFNVLFNIGSRN